MKDEKIITFTIKKENKKLQLQLLYVISYRLVYGMILESFDMSI